MASPNPKPSETGDATTNHSDFASPDDTSVSEYEHLRALLLEDEIVELAETHEQLSVLEHQIHDSEELIKLLQPIIIELLRRKVAESGEMLAVAIAPIIDIALEKKIENDRKAVARALAPVINSSIRNYIESSPTEIAAALGPLISAAISQQVNESSDEIVRALSPIMGAAIKEQVKTQREEVIEALYPIIGSAISRQVNESSDEITRALSPIMGAAIKEQVKTQREEVIEALYPVIGSTVAKYIKDFFDSINERLDEAFTVKGLARKMRAKTQGISEAELLFNESVTFNVKAVFLIHQSGLLITQAHPPGQQIMESDMVAGMLTAIQSFVNEWIEQSEEASKIDQIEYGTSKIILEQVGAFSGLAVVGEGEPDQKFRNQMRTAGNYLGKHFSEQIQAFDGDASTVPEDINLTMEDLVGGQILFSMGLGFETDLEEGNIIWAESRAVSAALRKEFRDNKISLSKNATVSSGNRAKMWLITDSAKDQKYTIINRNNRLNVYGKRTVTRAKRYPLIAAASVILGLIIIFFGANWYQNRIDRDIETRAVLALQGEPDLALYGLTAKADRRVLQLSGNVPNVNLRTKAGEVVHGAVELEFPLRNIIQPVDVPINPMLAAEINRISSTLDEVLQSLTRDIRIYFKRGNSVVRPSERNKILKIKGFLDKYPDRHLSISGHCDTTGDLDINLKLGPERAESVRDVLVAQGIEEIRLHTAGTSQPPPDVGEGQPPELSRCVLFELINP